MGPRARLRLRSAPAAYFGPVGHVPQLTRTPPESLDTRAGQRRERWWALGYAEITPFVALVPFMTLPAVGSLISALPPPFRDGYEVHKAALARGYRLLSLPRQVLLVGREATVPASFSFAHGVPQSSTVAAVTYAQDRRLRRAVMQRDRVRVPSGATFSYRSIDRADEYCRGIRYPIVLKEAVGENPARCIRGIRNRDQLVDAFEQLRKREEDVGAPGRSRRVAGYAQTRLRFEMDEEGDPVFPRQTRFLVEKEMHGRYVRIFSSEDDIRIAVELDHSNGTARDVRQTLHESFYTTADAARRSVAGLAVASVDIVTPDPERPVDGQRHHVVELAERVRIDSYALADPALADDLATALLSSEAGQDVWSTEPHDDVRVGFRIEGLRASCDGLASFASEHRVRLTNLSETGGVVAGQADGTPSDVALLHERVMAGALGDVRPRCIDEWPLD
jgi:hypothetical protein